jgi:UDP-2,3-diacylglucosamine pyrophosphatase LpxH
MSNTKRFVELVVISDTHFGTIGCRAKELNQYLKSIKPKTIVLNGDIIDMWQFNKRHWDKYQTKVIKQLLKFISNGTKVHYIAGNHDEALRRFLNFELDGFKITNKLSLNLNGKKAWFFYGDVFDVTMQHSRWLTRLGGFGYDFLILINATVNKILTLNEDWIKSKKIIKADYSESPQKVINQIIIDYIKKISDDKRIHRFNSATT